MTTTAQPTTPAGVMAAAEDLIGSLDDSLWAARTPAELLDGVVAVEALKAHLDALQLAMVAEIDATDAARTAGWASTKDFITHVAGAGPTLVRLANRLPGLPLVTQALRDTELTRAKATIIADAIHDLPADPTLRHRAETHLVAAARIHDPRELRRLTRRLLDVVDPDREDRATEKALDRDERAAHLNRHLSLADTQLGGCRVTGSGSTEDGALIRAVLLSLARPAPNPDSDPDSSPDSSPDSGPDGDPDGGPGTRDVRDHGARMWDALVELCRRHTTTDTLPQAHGSPVRLLLTMTLDQLRTGIGDVRTGTGETVTATTARRLACDAEIIPAVLGSEGQVLDVGRTQRLVTTAIFIALTLRDRHCAFPGCTRPPVMCHAHHIIHWIHHGPTSLNNLVLVCGTHHQILHNTPWDVTIGPDGRPQFHPPPPRHPHE